MLAATACLGFQLGDTVATWRESRRFLRALDEINGQHIRSLDRLQADFNRELDRLRVTMGLPKQERKERVN